MVSEDDLEAQMQAFLHKDDTPLELTRKLTELRNMKRQMGERFNKARKEMTVVERMVVNFDSQQQADDTLQSGASFYDELCVFNPARLRKAIDDKIAKVEAQIETHKVGSMDRMRAKLAGLMARFDDGKICKMAAEAHPSLMKEMHEDIRKKLEAEEERKRQPVEDSEGNVNEGTWLNGMKHGYGKETMKADGRIYEGSWREGKRSGLGKLT